MVSSLLLSPKILLFGDSLTEYGVDPEISGWVSSLTSHYYRRADIVVRGYSGYNSQWVYHLLRGTRCVSLTTLKSSNNQDLSKWAYDHATNNAESMDPSLPFSLPVAHPEGCQLPQNFLDAPDHQQVNIPLGIVWLGANDAATNNQRVPIENYKYYMKGIVKTLLDDPRFRVRSVLVITPPPVVDEMRELKERTNERAGQYAKACLEIVAEFIARRTVFVFDIYHELLNGSISWRDFFTDGLHLNIEGNRWVFRRILQEIDNIQNELDRLYRQGMNADLNKTHRCENNVKADRITLQYPTWDTVLENLI